MWTKESGGRDNGRQVRPFSAVDQDMVRKAERLVMEDKRMTIHAIMSEMGISDGSISTYTCPRSRHGGFKCY